MKIPRIAPLLALLLMACGQSGALYLPEPVVAPAPQADSAPDEPQDEDAEPPAGKR